ncbi:MAG: 2-oxoacid:acceptor oxidoreductase subunit alpha [Spirochaetes bacterium]|nr:2-oxoacid:acceptor oxidoreductase subunit alpha [Spirochaetota bacterium]
MKKNVFSDEVSIVLCGEAGQGINTIELILVNILKKAGYNIFATKEYMSRIRGGSNSSIIRVSSKNVKAMVKRIDILIPLDEKAIDHLKDRITNKTLIIADREMIKKQNDYDIIDIPFSKIAKESGGILFSNVVASGVIFALFNADLKILNDYLAQKFGSKGSDIVDKNITSAGKGYEHGKKLYDEGMIKINIKNDSNIKDHYFLNGTDAVGYGALTGGCNFIASYPMSPSTGVLTFLSVHSKEMGIVVEQAEDEIAAINMGLGAWYAGARALASTSGGGFALMGEGLSLAGIIESPMVIHIAQRPGPATGLPTRTEQGDLELALYSGHGEFPRLILAPSNLEDTIGLTANAFAWADKFQIPVIILTDQYFIDTYYNIEKLNLDFKFQNYFIKTERDYKRYAFTEDGISPRGLPDYGEGLVLIDSDEHDQWGRITEDENVRNLMVEKRLKKMKLIEKDMEKPFFKGKKDYEILVIGWGSTFNVINESLEAINNDNIAFLHFSTVYPVHEIINSYLKKAKKTIIIENNATGQFAKFIKLKTGVEIEHKILKYSGIHFYVEDIVKEIKKITGGGK